MGLKHRTAGTQGSSCSEGTGVDPQEATMDLIVVDGRRMLKQASRMGAVCGCTVGTEGAGVCGGWGSKGRLLELGCICLLGSY